jgi:hypothetical protein
MKKSILVFAFVAVAVFIVLGQTSPYGGTKPKDGYVPDADTAIKIAVAVWEPIFGKEKVEKEKPYHAHLIYLDTVPVWRVSGSIHAPTNAIVMGGVLMADIVKEDGRILAATHTK